MDLIFVVLDGLVEVGTIHACYGEKKRVIGLSKTDDAHSYPRTLKLLVDQ